MDDILEYLSRFLGPAEWLPDDAVIGRAPSIMGAGDHLPSCANC